MNWKEREKSWAKKRRSVGKNAIYKWKLKANAFKWASEWSERKIECTIEYTYTNHLHSLYAEVWILRCSFFCSSPSLVFRLHIYLYSAVFSTMNISTLPLAAACSNSSRNVVVHYILHFKPFSIVVVVFYSFSFFTLLIRCSLSSQHIDCGRKTLLNARKKIGSFITRIKKRNEKTMPTTIKFFKQRHKTDILTRGSTHSL